MIWKRDSSVADGDIAMATINTAELDRSTGLYADMLNYREHQSGVISPDLAALWQAPAMAGRRFVTMLPESGNPVLIRFVEGSPVEGVEPARQWGWSAIEITVQDVYGLAEKVRGSQFEIIGEPKPLDFSDAFIPMQVLGPSGEIVYLNQVDSNLPNFDLPKAQSAIDKIFICVLGSPDMDRSLQFYQESFDWQRGNTYDIAYSILNNAFGLPADTSHRLSMIAQGRKVINEIDQYPSMASKRPCADGEIPPGIAIISYHARKHELDGFLSARPADAPYEGALVSSGLGAAGERIEVIAIED